MDEQELLDMLSNFERLPEEDMGKGDYEHFLAQFMHAQNRGASNDQLGEMVDWIRPERLEEMKKYGSSPSLGRNPYIGASRNNLNSLLRGR